MKNLTLDSSGIWQERIAVAMTDDEKAIFAMHYDSPERKALLLDLRDRRVRPATTEDAEAAQIIYEDHRLPDSELIACDIQLPSGSGILNCRVNGEHKQIRF